MLTRGATAKAVPSAESHASCAKSVLQATGTIQTASSARTQLAKSTTASTATSLDRLFVTHAKLATCSSTMSAGARTAQMVGDSTCRRSSASTLSAKLTIARLAFKTASICVMSASQLSS